MTFDTTFVLAFGFGVAVVEVLRWAMSRRRPANLDAETIALIVAHARAEAKAECRAVATVLGRRIKERDQAIEELFQLAEAGRGLSAAFSEAVPGALLDVDFGDEPMNFDPQEN